MVVIQQIIQYIQVDVLSHHRRKVCLPKVLEKCQPTYLYTYSPLVNYLPYTIELESTSRNLSSPDIIYIYSTQW